MHKTLAVVALSLGLLMPARAPAALIVQPDRVIDTRTQLVWLNVWEGDALVNPHRLSDVAGGWRHATGPQILDFFFGQFGITPTVGPMGGTPYDQRVVDLMLHMGGAATTRTYGPGDVRTLYTITGWYRSDFFPERSPTFDEIWLDYQPDRSGSGLWSATHVGTIGSWTSLDDHPHPITFPQPHFLISALVPEPAPLTMLMAGLLAIASARRRDACSGRRRKHEADEPEL